MKPAIIVSLLWLLFGGSHVLLAMSPLRRRLPQTTYVRLFYGVASGTLALLVAYYATHRIGDAGPALGGVELLRPLLLASLVLGIVFISAGLAAYPLSPMATTSTESRPVVGLARVTRHPFMVGVILWGTAHALLSTTLAGTVFFGGFVLLAWLGSIHQDRKLAKDKGAGYRAYLQRTSFFPFAAILGGRQRLVLAELPWDGIAIGLGAAFLLRALHPHLMAYWGAPLSGSLILGALVAGWRELRG